MVHEFSLRAIAKKLGLSHSTVSRALDPKRQHLIGRETRTRILDMANLWPEKLGSSSYRTQTIGLVLPTTFSSVFFNEMMVQVFQGAYDVLKRNKHYTCKVVVLPNDGGPANLRREDLTEDMVGLLISAECQHFSHEAHYMPVRLLQRWKKPVVVLNLEMKRARNISMVGFSNYEAAQKAVMHLIKAGRRRVALIYGDKDFEDSLARYEAFFDAIKERRLPINPVFVKRGDYSWESGYKATRQLFQKRDNAPDALFCTNDQMAIGSIRALEDLKIPCPKQVAVVGFDGLQLGDFIRPRLTTVAQPQTEIARRGMDLLIKLIEGKVIGPQTVVVPTQLIVRESA